MFACVRCKRQQGFSRCEITGAQLCNSCVIPFRREQKKAVLAEIDMQIKATESEDKKAVLQSRRESVMAW